MSDNNGLKISRRRALAGIGAIGVASAGAGVGTSAYFSDTESFENNSITAGELDLKVDWQQTYNGPIPGSEGEVGEHPVNAYPDTTVDDANYGDGLQDLNGVRYSGAGDFDPVFTAADVPACCDCDDGEYYVTYGGETYCIEPLSGSDSVSEFYDYQDGGSGTFSSLNDDIQREDTTFVFLYKEEDEGPLSLVFVNDDRDNENGGSAASVEIDGAPVGTEPLGDWKITDDSEADGPDEYQDYDADWVWASGYTDGGALEDLADDFALRMSGQFNDAAELSDNSIRGDGQITDLVLLSGGSGLNNGSEEIVLEDSIGESEDNQVGPVTIHSSCGIESGANLPSNVFASENYPEQEHLVEFGDVKPGDEGEITFSLHLCDNPGYIWLKAANYYQNGGALTEPEAVAINETNGSIDDPGEVTEADDPGHLAEYIDVTVWYDDDCDNEYDEGGETEIFDGKLAGLMDELNAGDEGDEEMIALSASKAGFTDDCFPAEAGVCIGFKWEVPTDEPNINIIQGDELGFDLGFYTEQCRHNDEAMNSTD